jgi:hypothetical protein
LIELVISQSLCTDNDVWLFVMDVSLALAVTKQDLVLDLPLSIMLGLLLLAKCSHKLLAGRIDLVCICAFGIACSRD